MSEMAGTKVRFELSEEMEKKGYSVATKATLDGKKLARIGWRARVGLEEGLLDTVEWKNKEKG